LRQLASHSSKILAVAAPSASIRLLNCRSALRRGA
jgi:hypothetical protein